MPYSELQQAMSDELKQLTKLAKGILNTESLYNLKNRGKELQHSSQEYKDAFGVTSWIAVLEAAGVFTVTKDEDPALYEIGRKEVIHQLRGLDIDGLDITEQDIERAHARGRCVSFETVLFFFKTLERARSFADHT